jgi:hypothetical protein
LLRLAAAVRFNQTGNHVAAVRFVAAGRSEHGVGLSNAGSRTKKDLQMPAAFLSGEGK